MSPKRKETESGSASDHPAKKAKVVHPWIVPNEQELGMTYFITLGLVNTIKEPMVELKKTKLAGSTAIRRVVRQGQHNVEALYDQPTTTDLGASSGGIASGVIEVGNSHTDADVDVTRDDDYVDAQLKINMFEITPYIGPSYPYNGPFHPYSGPSHPSPPSYSYFKCKVCKDRQDILLKKIEAITEAVEELKSKRDVIPSKKVRKPYTPTVELGILVQLVVVL
ncbi:hypothetical protein FXO38_06587 [Capsicum annuum]|nr:hypothetical protein FXO38_06587 [Capsicum annuum]KAF3673812.1 hypothetical protein FXO37_06738 [Capsicum annuum]